MRMIATTLLFALGVLLLWLRIKRVNDHPDDYVTGHYLDPIEPPDDLKRADEGWD